MLALPITPTHAVEAVRLPHFHRDPERAAGCLLGAVRRFGQKLGCGGPGNCGTVGSRGGSFWRRGAELFAWYPECRGLRASSPTKPISVFLLPPFVLLDRYEISEEIGRGGHAVVFRARDRVLDRDVAVKILRDDAISADTLIRFRQEVQVTAQLEHKHILHVYDTGEYDGRPYIVMELASGRTLHDRLAREGQLPVMDALQLARDVGLALAHAHSRGVVHRDVKPENILLGAAGAILADFGIARVTTEDMVRQITSTGTTVGTVQYMSPEQLCAEPNIDARSDQYSLACVLYEMLAGVRPHISATFEGLRMLRISAQHSAVMVHRPRVPAPINDAILTALSAIRKTAGFEPVVSFA